MTEAQFQASQSLGSAITKPDNTMKIRAVRESAYNKDAIKNEANIVPDLGSTNTIAKQTPKGEAAKNPYENQINSRIKTDEHGMPKFTFAGKETYDQALILSQKIPRWSTPAENPINIFVPPSETTYKSEPDSVIQEKELRQQRAGRLHTSSNA